jgi:Rrf2 family iron-sulfur cluster assembly transcriptional regulator
MQVTRAVDYGLRALALMARQPPGARLFLHDLAQEADLPRNYLVKILKSLAATGIVRSHRGIKGGFSLGRDPRQISLRQIVEAIDGPVAVMHCLSPSRGEGFCAQSGRCAAQRVFAEVCAHILQDLDSHDLHELTSTNGDAAAPLRVSRSVLSATVRASDRVDS